MKLEASKQKNELMLVAETPWEERFVAAVRDRGLRVTKGGHHEDAKGKRSGHHAALAPEAWSGTHRVTLHVDLDAAQRSQSDIDTLVKHLTEAAEAAGARNIHLRGVTEARAAARPGHQGGNRE